MLQIKNLHANVNGKEILKGLNLTVNAGEIHAIIGPNGAGKTTSFYMVVGLVRMDKGEIHLDQLDLSEPAQPGDTGFGPVIHKGQ